MNASSHYVVTYYTDGMSPQHKYFELAESEEAAAFWNDVCADPYRSGSSFTRVEVIAEDGQPV